MLITLGDATQCPGKSSTFSSLRKEGGGVTPDFGKIETKDSTNLRNSLFDGFNFITEVHKVKYSMSHDVHISYG